MERIRLVERLLSAEVENRPRLEEKDNVRISHNEIAHAYSVSLLSMLLARKRGLDEELACIIGYLHDLGRIRYNLLSPDHASRGAEDARKLLEAAAVFSEAEVGLICAAISNHDFKDRIDAEYDELLKDADALDRSFHYPDSKRQVLRNARRDRVLGEFGIR